jgi:hypothetical protein
MVMVMRAVAGLIAAGSASKLISEFCRPFLPSEIALLGELNSRRFQTAERKRRIVCKPLIIFFANAEQVLDNVSPAPLNHQRPLWFKRGGIMRARASCVKF